MADAPRYINAAQVEAVLTWPLVNAAVEEALIATVQKQPNVNDTNGSFACQPARVTTICGGNPSQLLLCMPGYVGNFQLPVTTIHDGSGDAIAQKMHHNTLACKLVTSFSTNEMMPHPLPNILANILLFDTDTGRLSCIIDATQITAWRTAAASIIATKYLYFQRFPNSTACTIKLAIIGCGVQGQNHALGMCATFCVSHVYLWNRTISKAEAFAATLRQAAPHTQVFVKDDAGDAVVDADVICIATFSSNALIDNSMIKKHNVHINTVGAGQVHFGEVAQDIYDNAKVYVDSWVSAKAELQGLNAIIIGEVGEVIKNETYPPEYGITIFQSMGMAAEDATVAHAVLEAINDANSPDV